MKSSSESIAGLVVVVSGVGGAATAAAAEAAILLLDIFVSSREESTASAAFLFLGWEEMVSVVWGFSCLNSEEEVIRAHGQGWIRLMLGVW